LGKAIVEYARHFHFFDAPSATKDADNNSKDSISGWLFDVSEFSALPGRGIHCFIRGKHVLVSCLCSKIYFFDMQMSKLIFKMN
jgi:Cu+-exporting ATPase